MGLSPVDQIKKTNSTMIVLTTSNRIFYNLECTLIFDALFVEIINLLKQLNFNKYQENHSIQRLVRACLS